MKNIKNIFLGIVCALSVLSMSSCKGWLDVNTDPENPSSESAAYQNRLAHIEFYTNSAMQFANWRTNFLIGDWTRYSGGGTYFNASIWLPQSGAVTTPYQWWFVDAAKNISYMIKKAEDAGAYHYVGVGKIIWAYGNMLMTDLYGEMPFDEACAESATPPYTTGKEIWLGCMKFLEEGLEALAKGQDASLPALALGDYWMGGDVNKWVKFGNLLKARWINKLNKKQAGSYKDGKYDAQAILDALAAAQTSINDNAVIYHTDDNSTTHDVLGWDEPVDYSPLYSVCGMNGGYMVTKMLYDNLTNFAGNGVEDPRADRIIPWAMSGKSADSPAEIKWKGDWRRSLGIDMVSDEAPNLNGGPLRANFNATKHWWIDSSNPDRLGDTVYVECTSSSKGYAANQDLLYRRNGTDASKESGSFYSRVSSPTYLGTYSEACFIKAEVLFKKGDQNGAFDAYKAGIKASMEEMNIKLNQWVKEDAGLLDCPSFVPMTDAEMTNFLSKGIGTAANLSLGKIMTQKRLAMHFSVELYNDARRYDYNPEIFFGFGVPAQYYQSVAAQQAVPLGTQPRRWQQCSHELNYNSTQLHAIGAKVPGANMDAVNASSGKKCWNSDLAVWSIPVWWDSTQE